jgi:hypothetical protein
MSLLNENWIYDDDNPSQSKKAKDVLRKVKARRQGKKYKHVTISLKPLTIIEVEDLDGQELYGKSHNPRLAGEQK